MVGTYTKREQAPKRKKRRNLASVPRHTHISDSVNRRMLLGGVVFVIVALGIYAAQLWLSNPENMPIRSMKISGDFKHIDAPTIQHIVEPHMREGFWGLNTSILREQLQQLPWLENVTVRRIWPDQILIDVTEQQAVAKWNDTSLVNPRGQLFTPKQGTLPGNLPNFDGPTGQQVLMLQEYADIERILAPLALHVKALHLSSRNAWQVELSNGMSLILGNTDIVARLQRLVNSYNQLFAGRTNKVSYVDLRYSNGMAVKWIG